MCQRFVVFFVLLTTITHSFQPPIQPRTWARVVRGSYRNGIAYVLSDDVGFCGVLIVPMTRLAQTQETFKAFNEQSIRNTLSLMKLMLDAECWLSIGARAYCDATEMNTIMGFQDVLSASSPFETPHLDRVVALYVEAQIDPALIKRTYASFSASSLERRGHRAAREWSTHGAEVFHLPSRFCPEYIVDSSVSSSSSQMIRRLFFWTTRMW